MAIRKFKPVTPGTRWMSVAAFDEITKTRPEKALIEAGRPVCEPGAIMYIMYI